MDEKTYVKSNSSVDGHLFYYFFIVHLSVCIETLTRGGPVLQQPDQEQTDLRPHKPGSFAQAEADG